MTTYAEAEYGSWEPASFAYRAFCAGCPYCLHGKCTMQFPEQKLTQDWDEPPRKHESVGGSSDCFYCDYGKFPCNLSCNLF